MTIHTFESANSMSKLLLSSVILVGVLVATANGFETDCGLANTEPCEVFSYADLESIENFGLDKNYKLMNDIQAPTNPPENFTPIGSRGYKTGPWNPFNGHFDGNGRTIHNLYLDDRETKRDRKMIPGQGLFGAVGGDALINNLVIKNAVFLGSATVGTLAGFMLNETAKIENVVIDNPEVTGYRAGGLVGRAEGGEISGCHILGGTVNAVGIEEESGYVQVGGLVGSLTRGGRIEGSSAEHVDVSKSTLCGGLVGFMWAPASIENSFFTGTVSSCVWGGGLVGELEDNGRIVSNYAVCDLKEISMFAAGLVGMIESPSGGTVIKNNFVVFSIPDNTPRYDPPGCLSTWDDLYSGSRFKNNYCLRTNGATPSYARPVQSRVVESIDHFFDEYNEPMVQWGSLWTFGKNQYPSLKNSNNSTLRSDSGGPYCENSVCLKQKTKKIKKDLKYVRTMLRENPAVKKRIHIFDKVQTAIVQLVTRRPLTAKQIKIGGNRLNRLSVDIEKRVKLGHISEEEQNEIELKIKSILNEAEKVATECCNFA